MSNQEKSSVKKKITNFLINILILIISLCIAVVIVEITLPLLKIRNLEEAVYQVRRPVVHGIYGAYHPKLYYTLQKNLRHVRLFYPGQLDYIVDTNDQGFRGPNWDLSPRRKNVLILGDSFAFGWGVGWDQTIGRILERELQKTDPSYQVINLAIPGYDFDGIIRCFELYKDMLKPVAVVYIFCPNDTLCDVKKFPPLSMTWNIIPVLMMKKITRRWLPANSPVTGRGTNSFAVLTARLIMPVSSDVYLTKEFALLLPRTKRQPVLIFFRPLPRQLKVLLMISKRT